MYGDELLAFRASAGSGKTFSLTSRYLTLLFMGAHASEILTLTFTRKAALEMKTRIHEALATLLEEGNQHYKTLIQDGIDERILKERYAEVYAHFLASDLKIMTIDAFLHHVVKKFCWYAGIPYDFEVATPDSSMLLEDFLHTLAPSEYSLFLELCLRENRTLMGAFSLLRNLAQQKSEFTSSYIPSLKDFDPHALMECAQKIQGRVRSCENASSRALEAVNFSTISELLERGKTWLAKDSLAEYSYFKKLNIHDLDGDLNALKAHLKDYFCAKESKLLRDLLSLLEHFKKTLWRLVAKEKQLGFDEIAQGAYKLLGDGVIEREFLYFRLDSRITHLLIDEFQDTSLLQYRILEPLISEIKSGISRKLYRSFFCVGDPKQSIYRFRGSHAELFALVARDITVHNLPYNYRSRREIVDFVNTIFAPMYSDYFPQEAKKDGGYIKVSASQDPILSLKNELERLFSLGIDENDVAILVFNNDDVLSISEFLTSEFSAIKVVTETSAKLIRQKEVRAILHALSYLLLGKEVDAVSFLSMVGKSAENGLGELAFLEEMRDRKSSEIILGIMERYGLINASTRRFLEISLSFGELGDFVKYCEKLEEPLSTEELRGVRVLTIHKSKGLEFPYVFVLDRLSRASNRSEAILYNYNGVQLEEIFYRLKGRENFDPTYADALTHEEELKKNDLLNMLYVAFTRAREGLFLLLKEQGSAMDFLKIPSYESAEGIKGVKRLESGDSPLLGKEVIGESCKNTSAENQALCAFEDLGRQKDFLTKEGQKRGEINLNALFGEAFHMAFEHYLAFSASRAHVESLLINRFGYFLDTHKLQEIARRAHEILKSEPLVTILNKGDVKCEVPFLENGRMRRIDLLVACENEMIVVDYKSTFKAREHHEKQIESYKRFVSKMTKKPTKAYLFSYKEDVSLVEV